MTRPKLLDLFCGAGGASMGYHRAGFDVTGVDIQRQAHYPFTFIKGDALDYCQEHGHKYDVIHASPPCQKFSSAHVIRGRTHADLLTPCRDLMALSGIPAVIENVVGAPMRADLMLCGTMFSLGIPEKHGFLARHRWFEFVNRQPPLLLTPPCSHRHGWRSIGVYGHTGNGGGGRVGSGNHGWTAADWRQAMDIDWMNRDEMAQAIPPAYTEFIGQQLLAAIEENAA